MSGMNRPIWLELADRCVGFGAAGSYPSCFATAKMRLRVSSLTEPGRANARDTVDLDTAAAAAMSPMVTPTPGFLLVTSCRFVFQSVAVLLQLVNDQQCPRPSGQRSRRYARRASPLAPPVRPRSPPPRGFRAARLLPAGPGPGRRRHHGRAPGVAGGQGIPYASAPWACVAHHTVARTRSDR